MTKPSTEQAFIAIMTLAAIAALMLPIMIGVAALFIQHPSFFLTRLALSAVAVAAFYNLHKFESMPTWMLGSIIGLCSCIIGSVWTN